MSWQAFGASAQGEVHRRLGLPCQDVCQWHILPHGVICAVADGLGCAARAEEGARLAVETVLATLLKDMPAPFDRPSNALIEDKLRTAVRTARAALEQKAVDCPLYDYATTLLVAWVTDTWHGVAQIGDGAIVGRGLDGRLSVLSLPQRSEYANGTIPLTADDALSRLYVKSGQGPLVSVALLSDGLQHLALNLSQGTPYAPFFSSFFDAVRHPLDSLDTSAQLAAFLGSARVCARSDDDKTLVVAGWCTA